MRERLEPPGRGVERWTVGRSNVLKLVTKRAILRPFHPTDAVELVAVFQDEEVRRFLLDGAVVPPEWVREEITSSAERFSTGSAGLWSVRLAAEGPIVGFVGYREFFDPPQLQLLYGLLPEYWKRGLATEVSARACDFAFDELGVGEVLAAIDSPHHASRAVLERLGFEETHEEQDSELGTTFFRLARGDRRPGRGRSG